MYLFIGVSLYVLGKRFFVLLIDTLKSPAPVHLVGTAEPCEVATVAEQAVVEPEPLTTQYQAVPQVK